MPCALQAQNDYGLGGLEMKSYTEAELEHLIRCPKEISVPPKHKDSYDKGHYRNNMELHQSMSSISFLFLCAGMMFSQKTFQSD